MQVLRLECHVTLPACIQDYLYLSELHLYAQVLLVPIYLAKQVDHWQQLAYVLAMHIELVS